MEALQKAGELVDKAGHQLQKVAAAFAQGTVTTTFTSYATTLRPGQRGKQQGGKNRDDGDNYQEFDQGKRPFPTFGWSELLAAHHNLKTLIYGGVGLRPRHPVGLSARPA